MTSELYAVVAAQRLDEDEAKRIADEILARTRGRPLIVNLEGVILPWGEPDGYLRRVILPGLAKQLGFELNTPWGKLPKKVKDALLYGTDPSNAPGPRPQARKSQAPGTKPQALTWEGILVSVQRRFSESESDQVRQDLIGYMVIKPCQACGGKRLKPESLAVTINGKNLGEVGDYSIGEAQAFVDGIPVRRNGTPGLDAETLVRQDEL